MNVSEEQIENLQRAMKRIFALPLASMTLREVQNAVSQSFPGSRSEQEAVMNSLLSGEVPPALRDGDTSLLDDLVQNFSTEVRFAREVAEFGEFMNIFSCDFVQQGNQVYFLNRMRRVDGNEYRFLTQPEVNIRLAHMFINRLRDLKQSVGLPLDPQIKEQLVKVQTEVENLLK